MTGKDFEDLFRNAAEKARNDRQSEITRQRQQEVREVADREQERVRLQRVEQQRLQEYQRDLTARQEDLIKIADRYHVQEQLEAARRAIWPSSSPVKREIHKDVEGVGGDGRVSTDYYISKSWEEIYGWKETIPSNRSGGGG